MAGGRVGADGATWRAGEAEQGRGEVVLGVAGVAEGGGVDTGETFVVARGAEGRVGLVLVLGQAGEGG